MTVDWTNLVSVPTTVAAIVAYIAGIYSESFKKKLLNRSERNRLRNALYAELTSNLTNILNYYFLPADPANPVKKIPRSYPGIDKWFRTEVYETALKQQSVLLQEIQKAPYFSEFYVFVKHANEQEEAERIDLLRKINNHITDLFIEGKLSRRKAATPYYSYRSRMRMPFKVRLGRLMCRNMKPHVIYGSPDTLRKKIRALWLGRTEEFPRPPAD